MTPLARDIAATTPHARQFGLVNWRGLWSLYQRNAMRYLRYATERVGGPAVSSLLFLAVFHLALGGRGDVVPGVSLAQFIVPGIIVFSLVHNAFENAAVAIMYDKLEGMIGDVIGAPLTPLEILAGYALAAASGGLVTGAVILALLALFVELPFHALGIGLGFAALAALLFGFVGVVIGLWADRWDNYSAAETFLILPLGLLSGAFFSLEGMPEGARWLLELNPVFHAVQGTRFGIVGVAGDTVPLAAAILGILNLGFGYLAWRLFAHGYKIKP